MNATPQPSDSLGLALWLRANWINFGGFVLGVVGIVLAVVFYLLGERDREPFLVADDPTVVYSPQVSSIRVTDAEGRPIGGYVLAQTLTFFNAGDLAILPADVLAPIAFSYPSGVSLLEARIVGATRLDVVGASVVGVEGNRVKVAFRALDGGDGFRLAVVYTTSGPIGETLGVAAVEGAVLGAHVRMQLPEPPRTAWWFLAVIMVGSIGGLAGDLVKSKKRGEWLSIASALLVVVAVLLWGGMSLVGRLTEVEPPEMEGTPPLAPVSLSVQ